MASIDGQARRRTGTSTSRALIAIRIEITKKRRNVAPSAPTSRKNFPTLQTRVPSRINAVIVP